jgi:hypothetical protein
MIRFVRDGRNNDAPRAFQLRDLKKNLPPMLDAATA